MSEELPNITFQKRLAYKPTIREVRMLYKILNEQVFYGKLSMPKIHLKSRLRGAWGACQGDDTAFRKNRSRCEIFLADKWYCKQWLITTLAHEMVHQYQWDIYSQIRSSVGKESIMSHGPSFYVFRAKLKKHGIPLKEHSNGMRWFKSQNIFKC